MAQDKQTSRQTQNDRFAGLSNAEIVFVYHKLNSYLETLNKNLEKNVVTKTVETPMGIATAMRQVSSKHVDKFKATLYYKTACEVVEKLKPIATIIEECDSSIADSIEELK